MVKTGRAIQHRDGGEVRCQQPRGEVDAVAAHGAVGVQSDGYHYRVLGVPFEPLADLDLTPPPALSPDKLVGKGRERPRPEYLSEIRLQAGEVQRLKAAEVEDSRPARNIAHRWWPGKVVHSAT